MRGGQNKPQLPVQRCYNPAGSKLNAPEQKRDPSRKRKKLLLLREENPSNVVQCGAPWSDLNLNQFQTAAEKLNRNVNKFLESGSRITQRFGSGFWWRNRIKARFDGKTSRFWLQMFVHTNPHQNRKFIQVLLPHRSSPLQTLELPGTGPNGFQRGCRTNMASNTFITR